MRNVGNIRKIQTMILSWLSRIITFVDYGIVVNNDGILEANEE